MGHISLIVIKWLIEQKTVLGLKLNTKSEPTFCSTCVKAKPTRKSILKEWTDYTFHTLGDKIHSVIWGPANPQSYNGKLYYVGLTDDYTRWTTVYCIGQKSEVLQKYKEYEALLKTQYGKQIKLLQSDQGVPNFCFIHTLTSEVLPACLSSITCGQTQYGKQIKLLQSDQGGEFLSNEFTNHLKKNGTLRSLNVHDTPEENGVAE